MGTEKLRLYTMQGEILEKFHDSILKVWSKDR